MSYASRCSPCCWVLARSIWCWATSRRQPSCSPSPRSRSPSPLFRRRAANACSRRCATSPARAPCGPRRTAPAHRGARGRARRHDRPARRRSRSRRRRAVHRQRAGHRRISLTGESIAVHKAIMEKPSAMARPGGEARLSSTRAPWWCMAKGPRSCGPPGRAASSAASARHSAHHPEPPRLQTETRQLVRVFAAFGIAASLLVILLYGLVHGDWLQAVLGGIALGMSMLPEEFPLVLTAFMVMGAWRLSRARVLTRRAAAIEMLGAATVLCTDKTGTLTENRMTIAELRTPGANGAATATFPAIWCRSSRRRCWRVRASRRTRWRGRSPSCLLGRSCTRAGYWSAATAWRPSCLP